jgi:hypothetical protein
MDIIKKLVPFFLTTAVSLVLFSNQNFFSTSDSENMLNLSVSIYELQDMSIAIKSNLLTGEVVKDYSKYGLGLPLFLVPFLFLNDLLHAIFGSVDSNLVLALPNIVILAATAQIMFFIIINMGYSYKRGLFVALLAIFGTFVYPYAYFFLSEPLQALCIVLVVFCLYRSRKAVSANSSYFLNALGGIAYSYGILTKAAILIFLPLFVLYVLWTTQKTRNKNILLSVGSFIFPVAMFGVLIALLNYFRFGSMLEFGYGDEANMFVNPISAGVGNFLLNPNKSLFLFAPVMLILPYALWKFNKKFKEEGWLIIALFISNLLLYSTWWAWEGGDSWGPRFLLPLIPLSVIPCAAVLHRRLLTVAVTTLFVCGFFINFLVVIQNPTGYNYIVLKSTDKIKIDTVRPERDYMGVGSYKKPPPYVVSSLFPQFSVIPGHLWLLRAKYEGWRNGYGLSYRNRTLQNPPWIRDFPQYHIPDVQKLPREVGIRIGCPSSLLLSYFVCPDLKPSAPYYHDAIVNQAVKAEILGYEDSKVLKLQRKAQREAYEKRRRIIQMKSIMPVNSNNDST